MYVPKKLHSFPIDEVTLLDPKKDENGGITYYTGFKFRGVEFPSWKTLWITNDIEEANMNLYGKAVLSYAYSPGWKDWVFDLEGKRRFMERYSDPPIKAKAPKGINKDGTKHTTVLSNLLKTVRNGGNIVTPSSGPMDREGDYEIELMEAKITPSNLHIDVLNYDERLILIAIIQASANILGAKSHTGSYAEKSADINLYISCLESMLPWIEFYVNNYIMNDLRIYNFGDSAPQVYVKIPKIDDEKKKTASQIFHALVQNGTFTSDPKYLEEETGVPAKEVNPTEQKKITEKLSINLSNNMVQEINNIDSQYSLLLKKFVEKMKKDVIKQLKTVKNMSDFEEQFYIGDYHGEWSSIAREYADAIYAQGQDMAIQILQKNNVVMEKTASSEKLQQLDKDNKAYIYQSISTDGDKKFADINQKITYNVNDILNKKKKKSEAYTEIEDSIDQLYSKQTNSDKSNYLVLVASIVIGKGIDYIYQKYWNKIHGFERNEIMDSKTCVVCQGIEGLRIKRDDPRYITLMSVHLGCRGWWVAY